MHKHPSSEADLKALLVFVVVAGIILSGTTIVTAVNLSTRETHLVTQNGLGW